jgi:uncharacterized alkaline shock family protein YloU
VAVLAALVALGAAAVISASAGRWWADAMDLVRASRFAVWAAGLALVALAALFAVTGVAGRKRERFLSFDREGGTVSISTEAIADYVAKLMPEFPSVVRMRPSIRPMRRALDIRVDVHVRAGPQIHEVCDLLQRRIRESVTNGLGIADIRRVEVSVREIVSEHRPR